MAQKVVGLIKLQIPAGIPYTVKDLLQCDQLVARDFLARTAQPGLGEFVQPRAPFPSRSWRADPRPAPLPGEHDQEVLEDLERVVTHLLFLDAGRVQLFGTRDELAEHMREVTTPVLPASQPGLLRSKRDAEDGTWRLVVDERSFDVKALPPAATCRPLGLSDLFIALNG